LNLTFLSATKTNVNILKAEIKENNRLIKADVLSHNIVLKDEFVNGGKALH